MKKLIIVAIIAFAGLFANAAQVGWTNANLASYNGDKYLMFVVGQNGATDVATITALLDEGKSVDAYSIGGGAVANGTASQSVGASSPVISATGTYTAFMVLFDAATPVSGSTKYAVLQGASGYTKTIGESTASITFLGGNAASMISATTWKTFGGSAPVPEPTGAMLMLLGMAGLALKRKRA